MFFPRSVPASSPVFPEPLTVPGNVADGRYADCNLFIRKSLNGLGLSGLFILVWFVWPSPVGPTLGGLIFLAGLAVLTLVRKVAGGRAWDAIVSLPILVGSLAGLGTCLRSVQDAGWPAAIVFVPFAVACAYGWVARRDFSFAGLFCLGSLACLAMLLAAYAARRDIDRFWIELAVSLAMMLFFTYDLAMILRRRRSDEVAAAVPDLYRDLLNGLTYPYRIYAHWRRFLNP